jgi:hypothetical protein
MIHAIFDITGCQHADADPETIMTAMRQTADRLGCTTRAQVIVDHPEFGGDSILPKPSGLGWAVSHGTRRLTEPQA